MKGVDNMLKQLESGLKQLKTSKKALDKMSTDLIAQLPEEKRKEASILMNKARKGKVDLNEMMNFAGNIRQEDKDDLEKSVEKVNEKSEEVNGKK